ncbi:MAG TPA: hypothetical protein VEA41_06325 [Salinarimonas sp.]|nr:hypothetical protein [Salinarimonas sp.]
MPTLVQDIIDQAYGLSSKNRPGAIANEGTELVRVVYRALRKAFSEGKKHNRNFYGKKADVAFDAGVGGWARPDEAEMIVRIQTPALAEVVVVPINQRDVEAGGRKAVYEWGQVFFPGGNAGDPTNEVLTFFYSGQPRALTNVSGDPAGTLDPLWPEQFNDILILEVARYLARKDGRANELAVMDSELDEWYGLYRDFLQCSTGNLVKGYDHAGNVHTSQVVPA